MHEADHGHQGSGAAEAPCPGHQGIDLGVERLGPAVRGAAVKGVMDGLLVPGQGLGKSGELGDAAPMRPGGYAPGEGLALLALDLECLADLFLPANRPSAATRVKPREATCQADEMTDGFGDFDPLARGAAAEPDRGQSGRGPQDLRGDRWSFAGSAARSAFRAVHLPEHGGLSPGSRRCRPGGGGGRGRSGCGGTAAGRRPAAGSPRGARTHRPRPGPPAARADRRSRRGCPG